MTKRTDNETTPGIPTEMKSGEEWEIVLDVKDKDKDEQVRLRDKAVAWLTDHDKILGVDFTLRGAISYANGITGNGGLPLKTMKRTTCHNFDCPVIDICDYNVHRGGKTPCLENWRYMTMKEYLWAKYLDECKYLNIEPMPQDVYFAP